MGSVVEFACSAAGRADIADQAVVSYVAVLRQDGERGYSLLFPDFPGYLVLAVATVEDAPDAAQETLSLIIQDLLDAGRTLPLPTRLEDVLDDPDHFGSLAYLRVETPCDWTTASLSA